MQKFLGLLMLLLIGWGYKNLEPSQRACNDSNQKDDAKLEFCFDKRVETLYLVFLLSEDYAQLISKHPTAYKEAALKYFSKQKNHNASKRL